MEKAYLSSYRATKKWYRFQNVGSYGKNVSHGVCAQTPSTCFLATMKGTASSGTYSHCENINWSDPFPLLSRFSRVICYSDRRLTVIPGSALTLPSGEYSWLQPSSTLALCLGCLCPQGTSRHAADPQIHLCLCTGALPKQMRAQKKIVRVPVWAGDCGAPLAQGHQALGGLHVCRRLSSEIIDSTFYKVPLVAGAGNPLPSPKPPV